MYITFESANLLRGYFNSTRLFTTTRTHEHEHEPHFLKYQHQFSFILNYTSAAAAAAADVAIAAKYLFNRYEMDNEPQTHTHIEQT